MSGIQQRVFVLRWPELPRWDLKSARASAFRASHPTFKPLGAFIEEATEIVHPTKEPLHNWPVYGVSNRDGVTLSHHQLGKTFNAAYKRIRKDWFFHNPTRANVGSLGRVPEVPPDAITSPEYQVWRIKRGLSPDFVEVLIRLPFFLDLIEHHRVGAVKERLFVENLFEIPIPVLTENQQCEVVERWRSAHEEIARAEERVSHLELGYEKTFLSDLGLTVREQVEGAKCFALRWADLTRWGVAYGQRVFAGLEPDAGTYPVSTLGDLIGDLENGWSPKCLPRPAESHEWGVLKVGAVSYGYFNEKENKALPDGFKPVPALEVKEGDVLISRANITRLVGATAIVTETRPHLMLCDKIFRVVFREKSPIEPTYLSEVMKLPQLRAQIEAAATGTSATMQNITKPSLLALRLPVPPMEVQKEIVRRLKAARLRINEERERVRKAASRITADVEAVVLGTKVFDEV